MKILKVITSSTDYPPESCTQFVILLIRYCYYYYPFVS